MNAHTPMSFWKTAFIYGAPAGLGIISMMIASFTLFGFRSNASSQAVGFLLMFIILSLMFFGIKRYRDHQQGGVIKFSKALGLGLAMSLFAGLAYVLVWEIYLGFTGQAFISEYTSHLIDLKKAKGVSEESLASYIQEMNEMTASYANPLYRIPLTFIEIFPVGFIVALISSLALHTPKFWARNG